jgi:hypothetical protein
MEYYSGVAPRRLVPDFSQPGAINQEIPAFYPPKDGGIQPE